MVLSGVYTHTLPLRVYHDAQNMNIIFTFDTFPVVKCSKMTHQHLLGP